MQIEVLLLDKALEEIRRCPDAHGELLGLKREVDTDVPVFVIAAVKSKSVEPEAHGLREVGYWSKAPGVIVAEGKLSLGLVGRSVTGILGLQNHTDEEVKVKVIPYKTDFHARNQGIIDPSVFSGKEVLVCGIGSVGAKVAQDLARAGVEIFTLIDPDGVSLHNICRCECDLFDLGRPKPLACRDRILAINPRARIDVFTEDVRQMNTDVLETAIQRSSLAIWATDNPDAQRVGNGMTYHHVPGLYPGVYPQGTGGEDILTIPGETPCLECVLQGLLSKSQKQRGAWDYATEGQLKPEPALIADIQNVVTNTTKLALGLLSRGEKQSRLSEFIDPKLSVLFICNEVEENWIFEYPFQTVWASAEVNPDCWCRSSEMARNG